MVHWLCLGTQWHSFRSAVFCELPLLRAAPCKCLLILWQRHGRARRQSGRGCAPAPLQRRSPRNAADEARGARPRQARAEALRKGEDVPAPGEAFDSNCITPGTAFMGRLNEHLRFFVRRKLAEDPAWQRPRVVLSGAPLARAAPLSWAHDTLDPTPRARQRG
jgi:hypothetical protein